MTKMFEIVDDAGRVAKVSLSVWMGVFGLALLIVPEVLFLFIGVEISPYVTGWGGLGFLLASIVGRFFKQPFGALRNWMIISALGAVVLLASVWAANAASQTSPIAPDETAATDAEVMDIALPLLFVLEGMKTEAYQDIVGVWTICAGITRGVRSGEVRSRAQCEADTRAEFVGYMHGWRAYLVPNTIKHRLPAYRYAAFSLFAYNVGIRGAGNSTATKRLNVGNVVGACEAMTWWNKAGVRVIRGLVKRRACESQVCLDGSVAACPS